MTDSFSCGASLLPTLSNVTPAVSTYYILEASTSLLVGMPFDGVATDCYDFSLLAADGGSLLLQTV